jgi:hypothetical protein
MRKVRRSRYTPTFAVWLAVQARGPLCRRWRAYPNFRRDVGPRPSWMHLMIRDVSGEFSPGNAPWRAARVYRSPRRTVRAQ